MQPTRRWLAVLLAALMALTLTACTSPQPSLAPTPTAAPTAAAVTPAPSADPAAQADFDAFLERVFVEELSEADTASIHYLLVHPEAYGLSLTPATLGDLGVEDEADNRAQTKALLEELRGHDRAALPADRQVTYDVLEDYLERQLAFPEGSELYGTLFSPVTGLQVNLPITLSNYAFYTAEDIPVYLELLQDVDRYLAQGEAYLDGQAAAGTLMSDVNLQSAARDLRAFTTDTENNQLKTSFAERLAGVEGLSDEERQTLLQRNDDILSQQVYPAFDRLAGKLEALQGKGGSGSMANLPLGRAYYEALVALDTGSARTVEELRGAITSRMSSLALRMAGLMQEDEDILERYDALSPDLPDPKAALEQLRRQAAADFPALGDLTYSIQYVPEAQEESTSPAYYVIPPLDDNTENSIFINRGSQDPLTAYVTLAHEGYPGHMYQTNYFNAQGAPRLRGLLDYNGYSEGWASYVEDLAYAWTDYYADDPALGEVVRINNEYNVALSALIDIGIHYDGWTVQDVAEQLGVDDLEAAQGLYDFVAANPAYYLKYYGGQLEFTLLRQRAEEALGSDFDAQAFHTVVLDLGPCDFGLLQEAVDAYIQDAQRAAA
jgi:uncharacterized protein (DUF885 family)